MWTDQTSGEPGLHWAYKDGTGQTIRSVQKVATTGNILLYGEYSQPAGYTSKLSNTIIIYSIYDEKITVTFSNSNFFYFCHKEYNIYTYEFDTS